VPEYR